MQPLGASPRRRRRPKRKSVEPAARAMKPGRQSRPASRRLRPSTRRPSRRSQKRCPRHSDPSSPRVAPGCPLRELHAPRLPTSSTLSRRKKMPLRNWRIGAAMLASVSVLPATYVRGEDKAPAGASSTEKPSETSVTRQAIEWSQERLAELDATIAILEKNAAELQGTARVKADATLKQLRDT